MRFKDFRFGTLLWVFQFLNLSVIAQVDHATSNTENLQIRSNIDSLAKVLEGQEGSFIFFISTDFQEQKAYGCILKKNDTSITLEKLLISGNNINQKEVNHHLLQEDRKLILDFFNNPETYLNPAFDDSDRREISHDNRMFFLAKNNGQTLFKKHFFSSNYLASKNKKLKTLFLKLGSLAD
ncbi:MAG TPA: hypothetical protein VFE32_21995 [Puia sp.]|jgi:hypothetical protein|nr:hypothetical protein [Puia sp.]